MEAHRSVLFIVKRTEQQGMEKGTIPVQAARARAIFVRRIVGPAALGANQPTRAQALPAKAVEMG